MGRTLMLAGAAVLAVMAGSVQGREPCGRYEDRAAALLGEQVEHYKEGRRRFLLALGRDGCRTLGGATDDFCDDLPENSKPDWERAWQHWFLVEKGYIVLLHQGPILGFLSCEPAEVTEKILNEYVDWF